MNRIYSSLLILSAVLPFAVVPCCAQKTAQGRTAGGAASMNTTRSKTAAPKKVAMIGATAREPAPEMVLLPVDGPREFDLDASMVYKLKSHQSDPLPSEFNYLAGALQRSVQNAFKEKLGSGVVRFQDTAAGRDASSDPLTAARQAHARFILSQTIEEVRFEGNVVLGPWYQLRLSSKLIDGRTGKTLWQISNKKFEQFHKTEPKNHPARVMEECLLPEVTEYVASEALRAIDSQ